MNTRRYVRKTRDVYRLWWNGEIIDEDYDWREAHRLRREYALAFHCGLGAIKIKKGRERISA